ncbi:Radial spoke head protein 9 [Blyttiomyces sp. JEL0837]|nr:Radial spoke head protein 9 [Blyttiomyces sp. JEL0837]
MSFLDLNDLSAFTLAGFTLNTEERAIINTSLRLKAEAEKLEYLYLWGKILALQKDYWIAQAPGDNLFARKYFYSVDLVTWLQLPEITIEEMGKIDKITKRFTGDPAFEYVVAEASAEPTEEKQPPIDGAQAPPPAEPPKPLSEEKRLAGVIAQMNFEVQVVPRGAYYRDATLKLQINPMFTGVPSDELDQLTSYFHFREGFNVNTKTLAERATNFDETIDVFETIAKDEPRGVWSVQAERGGSVALLRSMLWPGYVFYHNPTPCKWGAMYMGWGVKNTNIGFMLP